MSRFAPIKTDSSAVPQIDETYQHGEATPTSTYSFLAPAGLDEHVVDEISAHKNEPDWMRQKRREAYQRFLKMKLPPWGADLSALNFESIRYYLKPLDTAKHNWADVPEEIKATFEKIGVPQAEREMLAGVKMQYDSEVIYGSLKAEWEKQGVIFLSMDEALQKHPDLVKEYFGTVIPSGDNMFAALNTAVWSGGSFVYVPPGVEVSLPLQTYFRINAAQAGQFERTLIIVDEGAKVHYVEGCFTAGTRVQTSRGKIPIEQVTTKDVVLTHGGRYQPVYNLQRRLYSGDLFTLQVTGIPTPITATEEHPFLLVPRKRHNEQNKNWNPQWIPVKNARKGDYVCFPIEQTVSPQKEMLCTVPIGAGRHLYKPQEVLIPSSPDFFRLAGYYLAEGSISSGHYLQFSFNEQETSYIQDVQSLLLTLFDTKSHLTYHKTNHGTNVVVNSTKLCRVFELLFGKGSKNKHIPSWMMTETTEKQKALLLGWFRGDGSYANHMHAHGLKENIRICTISQELAEQGQMILARCGIASGVNRRSRQHEKRQDMFTLVIGGRYLPLLGQIIGISIDPRLHNKSRATAYFIDEKYIYMPIRSMQKKTSSTDVFNFSVQHDESYTAEGIAVHNCTAPSFAASALHAAVVEIVVKAGGRCQYTTIQNWYKTVYNLVTKRASVETEGEMVWTDCNLGSKVTMKYPSYILKGAGARGETLSLAVAGSGQHQDTGSKAIHLAPHTSSTIISKSISKGGGRASYRGLVHIGPNAHGSKNKVVCDALLLDPQSRSDTYPTERVFTNDVQLEHEATVSRIGEEQLFYLMSRGLKEEEAAGMIVRGFAEPLIKKLPLEYAIEMNRLIDLEMEGSIG